MAQALDADTLGPVDVAVIAFDGNQFNGDVAPALAELQLSGTVRILDLAFISKDGDGTTHVIEIEDAGIAERFGGFDEPYDLLNDADLDELVGRLEPNSSALIVVWENTWAARLAGAIRESNGRLEATFRIPREIVAEAVSALLEGE